ncbi:hypothetical protein QMA10_08365 [Arthrobacter sp. APC 3897]|uniref:hypothetical protein n=1 Tax=Arthrobacter sp. APC 3897 TaxID=3035204 RepID=UPI0025B42FFE|nr:hypothetical protein [Arthrobacter sp. APC 3897]MDN3481937.1 hypothetical protein [Arthrobacter sp. APC 3897]
MKTSRADTAADEGFFPWPREVPREWILRAHPIILMVSALVLFHQFAPLPSSPMGLVSEFFVLSTAFSLLSARGRKKTQNAGGPDGPQSGSERPAE